MCWLLHKASDKACNRALKQLLKGSITTTYQFAICINPAGKLGSISQICRTVK